MNTGSSWEAALLTRCGSRVGQQLRTDFVDSTGDRGPVHATSAANRLVDHLVPLPTHDRNVSASSKNYRYSVNMHVVIDANTRLVVAIGKPTPGNRNDCRAFHRLASR